MNFIILVMANSSTLYRVAVEFDFPEAIVRRALTKCHFKDAGSLVTYLDDNMEELHAEEEVAAREVKESLRKETECLYKDSLCLRCSKNKRTLVLLPCSHYALCLPCADKTHLCPISTCEATIFDYVKTYF